MSLGFDVRRPTGKVITPLSSPRNPHGHGGNDFYDGYYGLGLTERFFDSSMVAWSLLGCGIGAFWFAIELLIRGRR